MYQDVGTVFVSCWFSFSISELLSSSGAGQWILLDQVLDLDDEQYQEKFQSSPLKRSKLTGLKRNTNIVKKNVESRRSSI